MLSASGAVLLKGPKSCGKTATAKQFSNSILEIDRDSQVPVIMATNPKLLLLGETPRLIDEWQELGYSTGMVKMSDLLQGSCSDYYDKAVELDFIIDRILIALKWKCQNL